MFEASIPGVKQYTLGARAACYVVKGLEYALSGIAAGFVGQGVSNTLMVARCVLFVAWWASLKQSTASHTSTYYHSIPT